MKVPYKSIVLLLSAIVVVSLGLTALFGVRQVDEDDGIVVVASTYPMYTATLQVVGDVPGVSVRCLTQPTAGCTHDYQLSPAERMLLEKAELVVINGGGAEPFLEPILPQLRAAVADTTATLATPHHEEHHEEHHDHEHEHGENEHSWMNPAAYTQQVQAICEALCAIDPSQATRYRANAQQYRQKIDETGRRLQQIASSLPFDKAVVFHESVAQTAEALGLTVVGSLPLGEDVGVSAAQVKAVADAIKGQQVLFFYDDQYAIQQETLMSYAAHGEAVVLSSAVLPIDGVADGDVWLYAMEKNIQALKEVAS